MKLQSLIAIGEDIYKRAASELRISSSSTLANYTRWLSGVNEYVGSQNLPMRLFGHHVKLMVDDLTIDQFSVSAEGYPQRERHPEQLLQLFAEQLEFLKEKESKSSNLTQTLVAIYIDEKGVYIDDERKYEISRKRLQCVLKLVNGNLTQDDMLEFWKDSSQISHAIRKINELVIHKLHVTHNLITHSTSSHTYSLDRKHFKIVSD